MKYWKAVLASGNTVVESDRPNEWDMIQDQVIELEMFVDGRTISLPKIADKYIQGKSAVGNFYGQCEVISRYIGFVSRNTMVKVRVDEKTNNISIETCPQ